MKKIIFNRKEYKFYTIFLCVIFLAVIFTNLIQLIFTAETYEQQALDNYYSYAESSLEQFSASTGSVVRSAMSLAATLAFDTKLNEAVRSGLATGNSDMMKYVKDCMLISPYAIDIAFYNPDMETVYSVKGGYRKLDDYWPGLEYDILKELDSKRFAVRPTNVVFSVQELLTVAFPSDPYYDSYIIVDLNFDEIKRDFKEYAVQNQCELYVCCYDQLLYQTEKDFYEHIKSNAPLNNGYKDLKIDNTHYIAVGVEPDTNGLQYTVLTKYSHIKTSYIMKNQIRVVLIYLIILFVGLAILYLSMRYSYKPIRNIEIGYKKLKEGSDKENEKKQLLEFITYPTATEKTTDDVMGILKKHLGEADVIQPAMLVIDGYDRTFYAYTPEERSAYRFAVENIFSEIILEHYKCMSVDIGENQKLFLIADTCEGEVCEKLLSVSAEHVRNHLGFSVSIILSKKYSFENLYEAYRELIELKDYRLVYPAGGIIMPSAIEEEKTETEEYSALIKECIAEGAFSDLPLHLDSYLRQLRKYESGFIISKLTNLLVGIYEVAGQQLVNCEKVTMPMLMKELLCADTVEDVKREFNLLFEEIRRAEEESSNGKYQQLVENVLKCIDENWSDYGFCADDIAKKLKYSGVYLSRIFKYVTGESLSVKIMQRRLEEGARLLSDSEMPVKAIFEKCAFSSNSYFSVMFKKQYGVTPSEYRRNIFEKNNFKK